MNFRRKSVVRGFRIPIAVKLIGFTTLLLAGSIGYFSHESAKKFERGSVLQIESSNLEITKTKAQDVERQLVSYIERAKVVGGQMLRGVGNEAELEKTLELTFRRDKDLVAVELIGRDGSRKQVVNDEYLKNYKLDRRAMQTLRTWQKQWKRFHEDAVFAGRVEIRNATYKGGAPLATLGIPVAQDDNGSITHIALADVRLDSILKSFSDRNAVRKIYLLDAEGNLIAHPDENLVLDNVDFSQSPIVKLAMGSPVAFGQKKYEDPRTGEILYGAFSRTSLGVTVVADTEENIILEGAREIRRAGLKLTFQFISVAIFLVFMISILFTGPIERLVEVAHQIAKGNFNIRTNIQSADEVGDLARAVDEMTVGLRERDKMKNVLSKFHGSSVAEDLIKGDLHLGGSKKEVAVFFSDIRDFTKFSEGHEAEEVVEMLNEYFQIMVGIINRNNGVVDKFIGDAIMAVWGAPKSSGRDAQNAVKACLEMRQALAVLNETRVQRGVVPIRIGMAVHVGTVISGNIGSDERMEYTIIGDNVNQASRIEASTKAFGQDLLISEEAAERVRGEFVLEEAGQAEVKGKSQALRLFVVKGYLDKGQPILVQTPYSQYDSEHTEKIKLVANN